MAVRPEEAWIARLDALPNTDNYQQAWIELALAIKELTDELNAVDGDGPIISFDYMTFAQGCFPIQNMRGQEWATIMSEAWGDALRSSIITPNTVEVLFPPQIWEGSDNRDVATKPTGALAIVNITSAVSLLRGMLEPYSPKINSEPIAVPFRTATLTLLLQVIGLGPEPMLEEVPLIRGVV